MADSFYRNENEKTIARAIAVACLATSAYLTYTNPLTSSTIANVGIGYVGYGVSAVALSGIAIKTKHMVEDYLNKRKNEQMVSKSSKGEIPNSISLDLKNIDRCFLDKHFNRIEIFSEKDIANTNDKDVYYGIDLLSYSNYDNRELAPLKTFKTDDNLAILFNKNHDYRISVKSGLYSIRGTEYWKERTDVVVFANDKEGMKLMISAFNAVSKGNKAEFLDTLQKLDVHCKELENQRKLAKEQEKLHTNDNVKNLIEKFKFEKSNDKVLKMPKEHVKTKSLENNSNEL